ncbi:purine-nucleoside phosphorylase [Stetteria hydrogenophila]
MAQPQHIKARPGEVARRVVVVGDPARAELVAGMLEGARLVNKNRGLYVYTGRYRGVDVSVAVHGIGAGSAAIVFEELRMLGAEVMVRLGTCGGLVREVDVGHAVVATGAGYNPGGTIGQYFPGVNPPAAPDARLTILLEEEARRAGLEVHVGPVFSNDAFYAESPEFAERMSRLGFIAVEMEAATLFTLAQLRRFRAGALLVASDNLVLPGKERLLSHEELAGYMEKAARAVLEAIVKAQ